MRLWLHSVIPFVIRDSSLPFPGRYPVDSKNEIRKNKTRREVSYCVELCVPSLLHARTVRFLVDPDPCWFGARLGFVTPELVRASIASWREAFGKEVWRGGMGCSEIRLGEFIGRNKWKRENSIERRGVIDGSVFEFRQRRPNLRRSVSGC